MLKYMQDRVLKLLQKAVFVSTTRCQVFNMVRGHMSNTVALPFKLYMYHKQQKYQVTGLCIVDRALTNYAMASRFTLFKICFNKYKEKQRTKWGTMHLTEAHLHNIAVLFTQNQTFRYLNRCTEATALPVCSTLQLI